MRQDSASIHNDVTETIRFSPLFNDAFFRIFGGNDSKPVTMPFLNAVLRIASLPEVDQVNHTVADASLPGGFDCRMSRLDEVILSDDGRVFDLEAERRHVDIANKSLYYAVKLLAESTPKGPNIDYATIPQVVVIVLLEGSIMFHETKRFVNTCRMWWDFGESVGPDRVLLIVAELDKVRARCEWQRD